MIERTVLVCALSAVAALGLVGCGSDREVEVTGNVSAPASEAVQGPISLDFLDVVNDEDTPKSAVTAKIDALGDFTQKVSVSGDKVRVRAIVDMNGDGVCSAGELWAETDAPIKDDDTVDPVALTLGHTPCPAMK